MKRFLKLFVTALLVVTTAISMVACGKSGNDDGGTGANKSIRVAYWSSAGAALERAGVECFATGFKAKNPGVEVNIDILDDYVNQFQNNMATGSSKYDVFLVPDGYFGTWVGTGVMEDLTERAQNSTVFNLEDMYDNVTERYMYNNQTKQLGSGSIYALPKDVGPYVMYYNKTILEEFYVDGDDTKESIYDHYEEYLTATESFDIDVAQEMWKDIKANDKTMYAVGNVQIEGLVWSNGGDFIDDSKIPAEGALTDPKVQEAYEKYLELVHEGLMPDGATAGMGDPATLFQGGSCATLITGRWAVNSFRAIEDFDWDVCPVPAFADEGDDPTLNSSSGSVALAIHKRSKNKELAWDFIEYVASLEGQLTATRSGFAIPFYDTPEALAALQEADAGKLPTNTECFINGAKNQQRNRMSALSYSYRWVAQLDTLSGYIFLKPGETGYQTVAEFLAGANKEITNVLKVDWNEYKL